MRYITTYFLLNMYVYSVYCIYTRNVKSMKIAAYLIHILKWQGYQTLIYTQGMQCVLNNYLFVSQFCPDTIFLTKNSIFFLFLGVFGVFFLCLVLFVAFSFCYIKLFFITSIFLSAYKCIFLEMYTLKLLVLGVFCRPPTRTIPLTKYWQIYSFTIF